MSAPTSRTRLTIRPLTPDLWPALEDLFGANGACNGCWCMYWRIGSVYTRRPRTENHADFRAIVRRGPPPGLLAFDGEVAVGWCQLTPRVDLPKLDANPRYPRVDDRPVWSVSCFYVRRGYRQRGISAQLIAAAVKEARRAGAPALEAYPDRDSRAYTGVVSTFARAGFRTVVDRNPRRPVMRRELRRTRVRRSNRATGS